jgi:hypothetical protein
MKKYILTIMLFSLGFAGYAQVGIGTATPTTTLHVVESGSFSSTTGITIPVVTEDMTTTTTDGTETSQLVYSTNASSTGYYYWNGTAWRALIKTAPSVRVTESNTLSNSDLNGYVIYTGSTSTTFDLSTLNPSAGDMINLRDASTSTISVSGVNNQEQRTAPINGIDGTISYIYLIDATTPANNGWWCVTGF